MAKARSRSIRIFEILLPVSVLAILLLYTYAKFFEHPYIGFWLNSEGRILKIFVETDPESGLQVNDLLVRFNSKKWEEIHHDLGRLLLGKVGPGQRVDLVLERGGQEVQVEWTAPGPNRLEVNDLLVNEGWLAYFFWAAGTFTLLAMRPRDHRWRLMIAFNYLTALWLVFGSAVAFYHIWGSAILMRLSLWFFIPVCLRLHWYFPRPLGKLPKAVTATAYVLAGSMALAEIFGLLPANLFHAGFLIAVVGSFVLLLVHGFRQPETRPDLRLLVVILSFALVPAILVGVIRTLPNPMLNRLPSQLDTLALISFPLLPLAYFSAVYRRQLGDLELRVNRIITSYLFIILLGIIFLPLIVMAAVWDSSIAGTILIAGFASLATSLAMLWGYHVFERFMERRVFGIKLPPADLLEQFSIQITASPSFEKLVTFIRERVLVSLLVRQFVFLQLINDTVKILIAEGVNDAQLPAMDDIDGLLNVTGKILVEPEAGATSRTAWVLLVLPLRFEGQPLGLWLFGRRDPDDLYSQKELPVLKSLADQTAIALSHMLQAGRLQSMFESNINLNEEQRRSLARDLHDSVLNALAALSMRMEASTLPNGYQDAFQEVIRRTREIASDLRPPMLDYGGLKPAIESLGDSLVARSKQLIKVKVEITAEASRYPANMELHLFRIVQEACENAQRHGRPQSISITGRFEPNWLDLLIEDDGGGFTPNQNLEELLSQKHYGLAGMIERASLIGGQVIIESAPQSGTRVRVSWQQA